MSSVQAVTEDIVFRAKIASFYALTPDEEKKLVMEFGEWLAEKGKQQNFLVWRTEIIKQKAQYV